MQDAGMAAYRMGRNSKVRYVGVRRRCVPGRTGTILFAARCSMANDVMREKQHNPVSRAIANAPVEDEPLTAEEAHALGEAREWLKHNRPIPHEQVLAELGITLEEIEDYKEPA